MGKKNPLKSPALLAIGGLDPSGHSGILADLRVWQHYRIPGRGAATAITAQSEKKFWGWEEVSANLFEKELASLRGSVLGVKIGMLATPAHGRKILSWLKRLKPRWVLWDPVMRSSTGATLLRMKGRDPILKKLLEATHILTPNIPEAQWFLGKKIQRLEDMEDAALELFEMGRKLGRTVVLKGGHLKRKSSNLAVDIFYDGKALKHLKAPIQMGNPRGTGCAFGSALLAGLYQGKDSLTATRMAKRFVLTRLFKTLTP